MTYQVPYTTKRKETFVTLRQSLTVTAATALIAAGAILCTPLPQAQAAPTPTAGPSTGSSIPPNPRVGLSLLRDNTGPATVKSTAEGPVTPGTPSQCEATSGIACYGAPQLRHHYGLDRGDLFRNGGAGQSIAVVMPFRHLTAQKDLDTYSDMYGLPRTRIEVIERGKGLRPPNPDNAEEAAVAAQTNLDLQAAHAMARSARLVLVSIPDWDSVWEEISWVTTHRDITVVSMSYGEPEPIFREVSGRPGDPSVKPIHAAMQRAAAAGTTLIAANGSFGPTMPSGDEHVVYPFRSVSWPASDPLVTGVAGTTLHTDDAGNRVTPDTVWTDDGTGHATGGGTSAIWPGNAVADIGMVAQGDVSFYSSYKYRGNDGWIRGGGTAAAAPLLAGITALAAQRAGHRLGNIQPALAALKPGTHGTQDVTDGCNHAWHVKGDCASPGHDLVSGAGTVAHADAFTRWLARSSPTPIKRH